VQYNLIVLYLVSTPKKMEDRRRGLNMANRGIKLWNSRTQKLRKIHWGQKPETAGDAGSKAENCPDHPVFSFCRRFVFVSGWLLLPHPGQDSTGSGTPDVAERSGALRRRAKPCVARTSNNLVWFTATATGAENIE